MKSVSKLICLATFFVLHFLLYTQLRALAGYILHFSLFVLHSSLLWYFHSIDYLVDDFHRGNIFGFCLIGDTNTVTKHIEDYRTYILRNHIAAVVDKGMTLGCYSEVDTTTWRSPKLDKRA